MADKAPTGEAIDKVVAEKPDAPLTSTRSTLDPIEPAKLAAEGTVTRLWFYLAPKSHRYDALFEPALWAKCASKLNNYDLVRCRASDGSYDVLLTVTLKTSSGVRMECFTGRVPKEGNRR